MPKEMKSARRILAETYSHPCGRGRRSGYAPRRHRTMLRECRFCTPAVAFLQVNVIAPQAADMVEHAVAACRRQADAPAHVMAQDQAPIAKQVDVGDLNVRCALGEIVAIGDRVPQAAVTIVVMNR